MDAPVKRSPLAHRTLLLFFVVQLFGSFSPEEIARIDALPVDAEFALIRPAGDGCNTCDVYYRKTGETTVRQTGWESCTLRACQLQAPEQRFK